MLTPRSSKSTCAVILLCTAAAISAHALNHRIHTPSRCRFIVDSRPVSQPRSELRNDTHCQRPESWTTDPNPRKNT